MPNANALAKDGNGCDTTRVGPVRAYFDRSDAADLTYFEEGEDRGGRGIFEMGAWDDSEIFCPSHCELSTRQQALAPVQIKHSSNS
jgi:hypothetical protein